MSFSTKTLLSQALALHHAGEWASAIQLYEEVFNASLGTENHEALTEATRRIGYAYQWMGNTELAVEYLELAHTLAELNGDPRSAARALNGLGTVYQAAGGMSEAETAYTQAKELAAKAGDLLAAGDIDQNLGTLANIRGDLTQALLHYQSSLHLYQSIDHERGTTLVLNNLGMLYVDLQELDEAESCFEKALEICDRTGDIVNAGPLFLNRAELCIARGELDKARLSCDSAFEITSRLGENRTKAEALKFYGIIYRETGKPHLAEIHLRQAIGISAKYSAPLAEAESHRELALVLRAQERNREALESLYKAHNLFSALQAAQDQADVTTQLTQLQEDFLSVVQLWGESIEAKDHYTRGHCQRVADYACRIAEKAGITERDMVWFRMGAFLHDVGKVEVPEEILNKPGKLTDDERAIMEQHTVIGDQMLAHIPFPWDIRPMVRSHHERWDGYGYPDGLVGEEIPLTARILRIADIFDALTTTRSYRQPLSADRALRIMEEDHQGFDPALFEIFRALFSEFSMLVGGTESIQAEVIAAVC